MSRIRQLISSDISALLLIQLFSMLNFSVLYSTLLLYMTTKLNIAQVEANSIMGVFVAFNFSLHLIGGYWSGRLFSNRILFSLGMLAQISGCLLLSSENAAYLYSGIAMFLTGSGVNITCLSCMLTQRFSPEDTKREHTFFYSYSGMNLGFFVGFALSGYYQLSQNYHRLFLLSSLGNIIALLLTLYNWHKLRDYKTYYSLQPRDKQLRLSLLGLISFGFLPLILSKLLHSSGLANSLIIMLGFAILIINKILAEQQLTILARNKMYAFGILFIAATIFWTLYQLGPMGLTHFIESNVLKTKYGFPMPPQWFQNINTICIVLGGPLLSFGLLRLSSAGLKFAIPIKFSLALVLVGLAFAILPIGILRADVQGLVDPDWIILCYILQSLGELLISPVGYAMIGALAPPALQGVMMGMWMLAAGVGASLSSYSSSWMIIGVESVDPKLTNPGFSHVFLILGLVAISAGILLFLFSSVLKRWMSDESPRYARDDGVLGMTRSAE